MKKEKKYFMGIDVGTTGTKVIVFDRHGKAAASAYQEYTCTYPAPGCVEQDCNMLMDAVFCCCRKAVMDLRDDSLEIAGISVSAQRSCTIFLDKEGQPMKMISWLDSRATDEEAAIAESIGREKFYEITGLPLSPAWILPKILYVRDKEPGIWEKTRKIVQLQDMVLHGLGGEGYVSDEPEAGFWGLWDNRSFCYSEELLQTFSIDRKLLPEIRPSGSMAGKVSSAAAEKTGIMEGTPLCVGLGDQNSASLGAGIVHKGQVSVSMGTGGLATALLDTCYRDKKGRAMVTHHAIHGMWTFEGLQNAAAGAFRWFRDEIAAYEHHMDSENVYEVLNHMIEQVPAGAKGLLMLPFFAGSAAPRWNNDAKGCFLGLTFGHDRACMARACVEGITLEQRDIMSSMLSEGVEFTVARIVGGAARSEIWNQIQADIYQISCETLEASDAAALGAAISAAVGVGEYSTMQEAVEHMVHVKKRYEPNPENRCIYEELYATYCKAYEALENADVFRRLGN